MFAQRFLGSPRGKHCNWLEGNVWRKFVRTLKKNDFGERLSLFAAFFLSEIGLGDVDTREA